VPIIARSPRFIGNIFTGEERSMADPKGSKATTTVGGASVQARNTIAVAMEDLAEANRKELEKELEEEMVERRRKKLACFQKTHHGIVKKADTTAASGTKMDSPLSLEDLVQLVDVSAASKYGAELTQFTRVVAEDMRTTLDSFKQDMNSSLPRQVRVLVQ
jgi:hypothetical protein